MQAYQPSANIGQFQGGGELNTKLIDEIRERVDKRRKSNFALSQEKQDRQDLMDELDRVLAENAELQQGKTELQLRIIGLLQELVDTRLFIEQLKCEVKPSANVNKLIELEDRVGWGVL